MGYSKGFSSTSQKYWMKTVKNGENCLLASRFPNTFVSYKFGLETLSNPIQMFKLHKLVGGKAPGPYLGSRLLPKTLPNIFLLFNQSTHSSVINELISSLN